MANGFNLAEYYQLIEQGYDKDKALEYLASQNISLVGWYDHLAEFADVRAEKEIGTSPDGDPLYQHIRFDGVVVQEGTPVNAENLGQMEWNDLVNASRINRHDDIIRDLVVQVATLIGQNNNNMPYNSFIANAKNIGEDIEMVEGIYDEVNGRGVV
ncbi:hypothetical protein JNO63_07225 [Anaerococcus sp. mt242]|uniref:hypothetical protein n=1 Tax=Anaerococcus sp. mt242 TaxID=2661917 RepID=UPI001931C6C1|nr:hypothetical protein [Anaerococcus sp. mt242]MBM0046882.1 hypothetical protein [Anaerococcus sp. mt242]